LPAYSPYQELESKQLVHDMMIEPADLLDHFKRYTSSLVTSVAYGFRWNSIHDPLLLKMSHNLDNFIRLNLTGSAALADIYPFLRYLPTWVLASKREAIANQASEDKMYADLYRTVKARIVADGPDSRPSVCKDVAEMQAQDGSSDEDVAYIPSQLWETGSDTTSAQLYGFAQALLLYPDVQTAGQAEVDRVVGPDRLPALHDMANLPYVRACVKETLRWLPIAILGAFPHASIKEDVYKGWRIPKGAMMMLNTWTIHRNPERYPNPGAFDPTRFINDNSTASESSKLEPSARDHFGFGAGRRICPGLNVAEQSMLLAIARIFWAVNVERVEGKVPTQDEFEPGFVAIPKSFEAGITPRSEARKEIVTREWEKAREGLDGGGQFLRGWMG
jgi:cytochrome P450